MNCLNPVVSSWLVSPTVFSNAVWIGVRKKLFVLQAQLLSIVLRRFCFFTACTQPSGTRIRSNGAFAQRGGYWITHLNHTDTQGLLFMIPIMLCRNRSHITK